MGKKRFLITSLKKNSGKSSMSLALANCFNEKCGYAKPLGDRLFYRKKRLWDHDSAVMTKLLGLKENPDLMTIGFDHSKLKYMYDQKSIQGKLNSSFTELETDCDVLLIESGKDIFYGESINMSAHQIAKTANAKMIVVVSGQNDVICDDLAYIQNHIDKSLVAGVIINNIADVNDFKETYNDYLNSLDIKILGIAPHVSELDDISMDHVCDLFLAKVIAGNAFLNKTVKHVDVGAMSINEVVKKNIFNKKDNLIITSGDRVDVILVALDCMPAGIILTNNILPPAHVISRAEERGVALLSVGMDTYQATEKINQVESLLYPNDKEKYSKLIAAVQLDVLDL